MSPFLSPNMSPSLETRHDRYVHCPKQDTFRKHVAAPEACCCLTSRRRRLRYSKVGVVSVPIRSFNETSQAHRATGGELEVPE